MKDLSPLFDAAKNYGDVRARFKALERGANSFEDWHKVAVECYALADAAQSIARLKLLEELTPKENP
jgi:hypothetical protein